MNEMATDKVTTNKVITLDTMGQIDITDWGTCNVLMYLIERYSDENNNAVRAKAAVELEIALTKWMVVNLELKKGAK